MIWYVKSGEAKIEKALPIVAKASILCRMLFKHLEILIFNAETLKISGGDLHNAFLGFEDLRFEAFVIDVMRKEQKKSADPNKNSNLFSRDKWTFFLFLGRVLFE
jgi:hypothetical protein